MRRTMLRSELYNMVWARPVTKVAQELGISDVGLSKVCARYGIPVPPRGHWAKLAGGDKSPQKRLPSPAKDFDIPLPPRSQPEPVPDDYAHRAQVAAIAVQAETLAETICRIKMLPEKPHPAITSTRAYMAKIPLLQRRYDRLLARRRLPRDVELPYLHKGVRQFSSSRAIGMLVSDESAQWALEMHQLLIWTLESRGCRLRLEKRPGNTGCDLACEFEGERVYLRFSESSGRYRFSAEEQDAARQAGQTSIEWEWRGGRKVTWSVEGTEFSLKQKLIVKKAELEGTIPEICATCLHFLELQPSVRQARLEEEARRKREAEENERRRRAAQARKEQVQLGFEMAEEFEKTQQLKRFLDYLDTKLLTYQESYPERIRIWVKTVREEVNRNPPYLKGFDQAFYVNNWNPGPPQWWPSGIEWPEEKAK